MDARVKIYVFSSLVPHRPFMRSLLLRTQGLDDCFFVSRWNINMTFMKILLLAPRVSLSLITDELHHYHLTPTHCFKVHQVQSSNCTWQFDTIKFDLWKCTFVSREQSPPLWDLLHVRLRAPLAAPHQRHHLAGDQGHQPRWVTAHYTFPGNHFPFCF